MPGYSRINMELNAAPEREELTPGQLRRLAKVPTHDEIREELKKQVGWEEKVEKHREAYYYLTGVTFESVVNDIIQKTWIKLRKEALYVPYFSMMRQDYIPPDYHLPSRTIEKETYRIDSEQVSREDFFRAYQEEFGKING